MDKRSFIDYLQLKKYECYLELLKIQIPDFNRHKYNSEEFVRLVLQYYKDFEKYIELIQQDDSLDYNNLYNIFHIALEYIKLFPEPIRYLEESEFLKIFQKSKIIYALIGVFRKITDNVKFDGINVLYIKEFIEIYLQRIGKPINSFISVNRSKESQFTSKNASELYRFYKIFLLEKGIRDSPDGQSLLFETNHIIGKL